LEQKENRKKTKVTKYLQYTVENCFRVSMGLAKKKSEPTCHSGPASRSRATKKTRGLWTEILSTWSLGYTINVSRFYRRSREKSSEK
jgi:hypothetical protein